jgi:hydrogenase large subunit
MASGRSRDIMRALNPFTGAFYLEALKMSRLTREMFCLMEGGHVLTTTAVITD